MLLRSSVTISAICRKQMVCYSTSPVVQKNFITGLIDIFKSFGSKSEPKVVKPPLQVLQYPHPKLRKDNEIIKVFDAELEALVEDLRTTLHVLGGSGLAAPQVGINKRLMVVSMGFDTPEFDEVMINPRIISSCLSFRSGGESCLSFPDFTGDVSRPEWVEVEYQNVKGQKLKQRYEGYQSVLFLHEYDHLDKVLFIDRLQPHSRDSPKVKAALAKLIADFGPGGAP